eukprot:5068351-Pyramimonas_sp.AAC.1
MIPEGGMIARGRETYVQATSRPDHVPSEYWDQSTTEKERRIKTYHAKDILCAREVRNRSDSDRLAGSTFSRIQRRRSRVEH